MLLWLLFALLTAAALTVLLAPLTRAARGREPGAGGTLAVYRHQLEEIEAERERGWVSEAEALAARAEVSRRLLASADADENDRKPASLPRHAPIAATIAALVPLLTIALYLARGSPGLPSYPMAGRVGLPVEQANIAELFAKVERQLRDHPEDGQGWDLIAPIYFRLGRFREAADAYLAATRLQGETVGRLAGFAEAAVLAADGIVSEEARVAFEKISQLEPARPEPRFWLALAKEQDGKLAEALADYRALLAQAPAGAAWRKAVDGRVAELSRRLAAPGKSEPPPPGPSSADVIEAEKLPAEARARMIGQMVDGLAERLKRDGSDLTGWLRLVNAYAVLDRRDEARAALAQARQHFPTDEKALGELAALAKRLGLGS
ncbi:MAG: c-type cytochrome biogenesis protein CcmI [Hyphomicrobiaceae bacterium]|nr:c-type cytochrome biogenesis protein CcmI [Hyphomicrobiaceae bacterium]